MAERTIQAWAASCRPRRPSCRRAAEAASAGCSAAWRRPGRRWRLAGLLGGGGGGTGSFNIGQIKDIVDRLGGVEGIVSTFGKVQTVVQSMSQMAPMIKLLLGSFGKGKKSDAEASDDGDGLAGTRRKRRKRKGPVRGRRRRSTKR
ncbi:hypothetical protein [Paenibacillus mucilaginosus]|uniref:hypothetical protein n=1 Tax=Paenibacillus mucilaginosus TaxID=61624 RepID=UPI00240DC411|nr:hypothetical protein [Paenibacillus mucilaginosus]